MYPKVEMATLSAYFLLFFSSVYYLRDTENTTLFIFVNCKLFCNTTTARKLFILQSIHSEYTETKADYVYIYKSAFYCFTVKFTSDST